jgi:hypothetical protein
MPTYAPQKHSSTHPHGTPIWQHDILCKMVGEKSNTLPPPHQPSPLPRFPRNEERCWAELYKYLAQRTPMVRLIRAIF